MQFRRGALSLHKNLFPNMTFKSYDLQIPKKFENNKILGLLHKFGLR